MELEIIYQDDYLIAINKPNGLLVHRTQIAAHEDTFAVQLLRDQIGKRVHPVHRLDRKTSGVLLFAFESAVTKNLQSQFIEGTVDKKYEAIVRGYFPESSIVDYPLTNDRGKTQAAITHFKLVRKTELPIPFGKHPSSRYSLIEARPETGRMHQIRKHLNHLRHPIIGDRPHGCNKQNKLFKERWKMTSMLLHAVNLSIKHPLTNAPLQLIAPRPKVFTQMVETLGL